MPNNKLFEDTLKQQLNTLRIDGGIRKKVIADLRKLEKSIVEKIANIAPEDASKFKAKRLNQMLKEVNEIIDTDFNKIDASLEEQLIELASIESAKQGKTLDQTIELGVNTTTLSAATINKLYKNTLIEGAPSAEWWSRQSRVLQQKFEDQMRQGILLGETNQKLIARVRGTKDVGYTNGIMSNVKNNAEALVRSSVQAVANQARFEVMEANNDIIGTYRHVSTLDSRTSDVCIARDGKRWDAKTKKPIGHNIPFQVPPIHWNCRSTVVAEVKGTQLGDDAERASAFGPVPANTDFKDFLKSQGKAFQDEVLGVGKADLWRKGKITLNQLLDQQGNPLTLAELKTKYN